ncbi:MAG TPA: malto-oligosyltrehalose synthase [Mycobacteriales bacterium]|nr:malto-oligosyltrehalose synthase [Mycobacteriales bacterium]
MSQRESALTEPGPVSAARDVRHLGSTYRLQLNGMGFDGAREAVPFLADLGVETLYVSPITRARHGSAHGYDVIDPTVIDPSLGGRAGYEDLLDTLGDHDMRLLIDIVPNHMAASVENPMFADVLRLGRRSRYAPVFDIAWEAADNAVVLPILDSPLPAALDSGRLRLLRHRAGMGYELAYDDLRLPLDPADDEDLAADLVDSSDAKEPGARRQLELVLSHQHYRLVDWRTAAHTVNYRRFFDINDLIGIRQEDPEVFDLTHQLVIELAADERVAGVRVDHVDGLRDPAAYLTRLRQALDRAAGESPTRPVLLVEKILEHDERLPAWPVEGTTGYEFAAAVTGLFIDAGGAEAVAASLAAATGDTRSFRLRGVEAKRRMIDVLFPARIGYVSQRITRAVPQSVTRPNPADISVAVQELCAQLDVYRTYRRPGERLTVTDRRRLEEAAAATRRELNDRELIALDQALLVLRGATDWGAIGWDAVAAWQQLTPAVTAKGVEDTALYSPGTLLAAADVGTQPDRPAVSVEQFHARMRMRAESSRFGLSALSTHDSKRSHDVRCRLAVLSEMAARWISTVEALDLRYAADRHDGKSPDTVDRRYLYESLVGAWPVGGHTTDDFLRRVQDHVVKAAREAKRNSSWLAPDEDYETGLQSFAAELLDDDTARKSLEAVVAATEPAGITNSLASVLLRATAPGVPDVYQSDDTWLLAYVDPDNRRPLDLDHHKKLLAAGGAGDLSGWRDGHVKQALIQASLRLRREVPDLFAEGKYLPLTATGPGAQHVLAFARVTDSATAIVVVPRLSWTLAGDGRFPIGSDVWGDTAIQLLSLGGARFINMLTGAELADHGAVAPVGDVLSKLPVALLFSG